MAARLIDEGRLNAPTLPSGRTPSPRHGLALAVLIAVVATAHFWLTYQVSQEMKALAPPPADAIQRMEASYVSEVRLSKPPSPPAPPKPPQAAPKARKKPKPRPVEAASAPQEVASAPPEAPQVMAQADTASSPVAASAPPEPALQAASAASSPKPGGGPAFIWPKSTRVSYKLEGQYRGPVYGESSVEWVRQEMRYQVRVDSSIQVWGTMSLISEGDITPEGLVPRRYQNTARVLFKNLAPRTVQFEESEVVLPSGARLPRLPGMQDPASQFVQLAYRFILNPSLLTVGNTIEMPLVWLKKTETVLYDVVGEETLRTPMGDLATFHVKPRNAKAEIGNAFSADIWFAPELQYLPVRIYLKLSDEINLDLQMDRTPQQTPGDAPAGSP